MDFTFNLSDTEYLIFKTHQNHFDLFSGHEGNSELKKIAKYRGGKWLFDSFDQQKLFWFLFNLFRPEFGKALKAYSRAIQEKPKTYMVVCAKRRIDIKITKLKRTWFNWVYDNFYKKQRHI
jgi:hypothetical protein